MKKKKWKKKTEVSFNKWLENRLKDCFINGFTGTYKNYCGSSRTFALVDINKLIELIGSDDLQERYKGLKEVGLL